MEAQRGDERVETRDAWGGGGGGHIQGLGFRVLGFWGLGF